MKDDAGAQQNSQHLFGIAFCRAPWIFYEHKKPELVFGIFCSCRKATYL